MTKVCYIFKLEHGNYRLHSIYGWRLNITTWKISASTAKKGEFGKFVQAAIVADITDILANLCAIFDKLCGVHGILYCLKSMIYFLPHLVYQPRALYNHASVAFMCFDIWATKAELCGLGSDYMPNELWSIWTYFIGFWLIWYSTKWAYAIMICPSCIVVGVVSVSVSFIGICAQPS